MKRTIASAAALCLALGLVLTGCGSKDKAVYVQQVSSLTGISSQDRFSGLVVSENLMEIKKDSDKEVAELLVKEGQDVQEGDPLFSYDTDQLQLNADKLDLEREQLSASISAAQPSAVRSPARAVHRVMPCRLPRVRTPETSTRKSSAAPLPTSEARGGRGKSSSVSQHRPIIAPARSKTTTFSKSPSSGSS